ncbi:unnamed protein product [Cochlearia groenlandica]
MCHLFSFRRGGLEKKRHIRRSRFLNFSYLFLSTPVAEPVAAGVGISLILQIYSLFPSSGPMFVNRLELWFLFRRRASHGNDEQILHGHQGRSCGGSAPDVKAEKSVCR